MHVVVSIYIPGNIKENHLLCMQAAAEKNATLLCKLSQDRGEGRRG